MFQDDIDEEFEEEENILGLDDLKKLKSGKVRCPKDYVDNYTCDKNTILLFHNNVILYFRMVRVPNQMTLWNPQQMLLNGNWKSNEFYLNLKLL